MPRIRGVTRPNNRVALIPAATSSAKSRIEFKLEVVQMFKHRIEQLDREKLVCGPSHSRQYKELERATIELRTLRLEIESLEFNIDTGKGS